MSVQYYDENAQTFFDSTVSVDVSTLHAPFLRHLPKCAKILDAGCGSGRDAKAFLAAGHEVVAFDASPELVRLARAHTGLPVELKSFSEVDSIAEFDGIWACASLLHVPRLDLPGVLSALRKALKPDGVFYLSFKYGTETRTVAGRTFTDVDENELTQLAVDAGFEIVEAWITEDVRPDRRERWTNAVLRKAGLYSLSE